ncbi:REP-associated tyrosine transposase [Thiocystis violascens]|uniref:Transposase n=1 Tax=Thiocystis violascens (strain ATCC 17096 / DSM 198 / 6111) TaxID=765911 RepID=I3YAK5_THIV6|nr:transposase [Thiocystis violascens]AFL74023.1 transposase [Thiocystis violascens DSM 198]
MTEYRRAKIPGATFFFTVNLAQRRGNRLLVDKIDLLRRAFREVKDRHPFVINAIVVLPEHLHTVWTLPEGDSDYKTRWSLIKAGFSRRIPAGERRSDSRVKRGERGIWQRRYWEHVICDDGDLERHVNYIHWNPVKHGWVQRVADWPYSSFHLYVQRGVYCLDWACDSEFTIKGGE